MTMKMPADHQNNPHSMPMRKEKPQATAAAAGVGAGAGQAAAAKMSALIGIMLGAKSAGEQATSGPGRDAVSVAMSAVQGGAAVPAAARSIALRVLSMDAQCQDHAGELIAIAQRQHGRPGGGGGVTADGTSMDFLHSAAVGVLGPETKSTRPPSVTEVMVVSEMPLPVLRRLLGERDERDGCPRRKDANSSVAGPSGRGVEGNKSVLLLRSSPADNTSEIVAAACLAMSRSLLRDDVCSAAGAHGPLRKCVIEHWLRLASLATGCEVDVMSQWSPPSSPSTLTQNTAGSVLAAAFSGIGALLRLPRWEYETQEEATYCVVSHIAEHWDAALNAALSPLNTQSTKAEAILVLTQCARMIVKEGGSGAIEILNMQRTIAAISPVLHSLLSSFSPVLVETAATAVLNLSEIVQNSGDLPLLSVAAVQAAFSLWDRRGCGTARSDVLFLVARASSNLAPAVCSVSISKCIGYTRTLRVKADRLRCLSPLCMSAMRLARWNVAAHRKGLYRPSDVRMDLQILNAASATRESPFREELFSTLMFSALSVFDAEMGMIATTTTTNAERNDVDERAQMRGGSWTNVQLEWMAVFTQAIELVACCLHWEVNPYSRTLQALWFKLVVRMIGKCKRILQGESAEGAQNVGAIVGQIQSRIHTVLRTLLSSVNTIKDFTLNLQIFWCVGCHIGLNGDDAADIANNLAEKVAVILRAVAKGTAAAARHRRYEDAAAMGVIVPRAAGATDEEVLTQMEYFAVEIAFVIVKRFWFIDSDVTRQHLGKILGSDGPVVLLGRSQRVDAVLKDRCWRMLQLAASAPPKNDSPGASAEVDAATRVDHAMAKRIFDADGSSFGDDQSLPFDSINPTSGTASSNESNESGHQTASSFLSSLAREARRSGRATSSDSEATSTTSSLVDMSGAGDLVAILGEHHSSKSGENLIVTFHVTNQSSSALQEITLSAMLLGPVSFAFASQRQTFQIAGLQRGESCEWRIPLRVNGVAQSSVMLEMIVRLDDEDGTPPITIRSQDYRLPLCASLRLPLIAADPGLFYAKWSALAHESERHAQVELKTDTFASKMASFSLQDAPSAAEALSIVVKREFSTLPIQYVCGECLRDFGTFRLCFLTETSAGDTVSMVVHGVAVSTANGGGDISGVVTVALRSSSAEVVSTMEASPQHWFANLFPNTQHKVIDAGSTTAGATAETKITKELLALSNSAAVDASSVLNSADRDLSRSTEHKVVALGEFNLSVVTKWRQCNYASEAASRAL